MLCIGEKVPNFRLPASGGQEIGLSDFQGQYVVLYFYPRDNTPGCTTQSIDFSNARDDFSRANTVILGVSKDSVESHEKFIQKRELTIPLLSDENDDLCEAFDVWTEKSMYGKKFMGIIRSTFLIDPNGILIHAWRKVKVPNHVDTVLSHIKEIQS